ncbi:hypothetical protein [Emticicia sp. 21SJ11W-3]|uniref:hypothetical protein n=1 Tax=Emticicia sp. 21SJ11W-3 TaxID=2916755 RepID=UPI00209EDC75|nr:hypothetical protein [Emticicia sp. 21SJ11W-3]UTA66449.1 hypothetical protein MB380_12650 [Emticicia sp. 21SJ11W-3]
MADQNQEREVILLTIDIATLVYLTGFALIFALILVLKLKHWKDTLEKLETRAQQVQAILLERLAHQNKFLNQLRKELHESPCQLLFVAQINLNMAEEDQPTGDEHILLFTNTNRLITQTIQELRNLMRRLEEAAAPAESLTAGIRHELDKIRNTTLTDTRMTVVGRVFALRPEQEIILLKMIQELWSTTDFEIPPAELWIDLRFEPDNFTMLVSLWHGSDVEEAQRRIIEQQTAETRKKCRLIDFDCRQAWADARTVVFEFSACKQGYIGSPRHYCW